MWNIFYWSCYTMCIRRAKASWLTVFWLSNRSHTLTLKDYKRSDPIWVCFVNTYESIAPQCSQRPWLQNILRTELVFANLNPVIPILPQKEWQWLTLPFSWVWEPANIHSQFHLVYHVWWLEVSWSAGLALSADKHADSISTYLFWLF